MQKCDGTGVKSSRDLKTFSVLLQCMKKVKARAERLDVRSTLVWGLLTQISGQPGTFDPNFGFFRVKVLKSIQKFGFFGSRP